MARAMHKWATFGVLLAATVCGVAIAQEKTLVVSASGGTVGDAWAIYNRAFEQQSGWKVNYVAAETDRMPQIEAMVKARNAVWDVSEISGTNYPIAVDRSLLEEIDYSKLDPDGTLAPEQRQKYAVATGAYSTVLVQRTDKSKDGRKMQSWADFWDVKSFPGPRSLNSQPEYNLEFALLADGVPEEDLYKILSTDEGIERALKKLDDIKPYVPVWWTSGAQTVQLLSSGEVFYTTTYNGRVAKLKNDGLPVEIMWNGAALHMGYAGIIKGSKNLDAALKYLRMRTASPDLAREYVKISPYAGFSLKDWSGFSEDFKNSQSTNPTNVALQFVPNEEFWAKNKSRIAERWTDWMLK